MCSCDEYAADDVWSMFLLSFNLKIERFVSENKCNSALIRMGCRSSKYRIAVRRPRVAVGG
jgi:hypothetical protein